MFRIREEKRVTRRSHPPRSSDGGPTRSAGSATLEWQIRDEDEPWNDMVAVPDSTPSADFSAGEGRAHGIRAIAALLILLVASTVLVLWWRAETGARILEDELRATVTAEQRLSPGPDAGQDGLDLPESAANVRAQDITFHGAVAGVRVETTYVEPDGDTRITHQRKFYRSTDTGWVRVSPNNTDLGRRDRRQTALLTFEYAAVDSDTVASVAAGLDSAYADLRRDFRLPPPTQRLLLDVDISHPVHEGWSSCFRDHRVCVGSPAVTAVPAGVTEEQVLRLWGLNALAHHTLHEALATHPMPYQWQDATGALLNYQMRRHSDLLAAWHEDLAAWLYSAAQEPEPDPDALVRSLRALCDRHRIPEHRQILRGMATTYLCDTPPMQDLAQLARRGPPDRLVHLLRPDSDVPATHGAWVHELAFETVFDYAPAAFGPDVLPALVTGFRHYDSWDTLIPAVFDVPVEEFERGWQNYLQSLP